MFFKGSRYLGVQDAQLTDGAGRTIRYKKVRFIAPVTGRLGHIVAETDRLDLIANRYYRDPLEFWRICDGNRAMFPPDLVSVPGRVLRIPSGHP
jgi:hypothetical protein